MAEFYRTESAISGLVPGSTIATCMLREAEAWTGAQCELVSGIGVIWTDWLKRQREAIHASSRSLQQVLECHSLADLAQIQQQWLADSARREIDDISALTCDAMALPWAVMLDRVDDRAALACGMDQAAPAADAPVQRAAAA